ncbi:MAG: lasso peptide biosynthesis B2 protein [Litorilinea sp.]
MQRFSPARILIFAEAFLLLGIVRLGLIWFPFRRITRMLGLTLSQDEPRGDVVPPPAAIQVARAVCAAARRTPWESKCLVQALGCAWMLRRRNLTGMVYLGMLRQPDPSLASQTAHTMQSHTMQAHAWLRMGNTILTGASGHEAFTVVARFLLARA